MSGAAEREMTPQDLALPSFRKIVLCTDFSPASEAAARVARWFTEGRDATLTLLHVSEYGPMPAITKEGLQYVLGLYKKEHLQLRTMTDSFLNSGVRARAVMLEGNATSCILEHIKQEGADLAIAGTTAARGLDRLLFGSTAEIVLRRAPCPVLTVGPNLTSVTPGSGRIVVFATDFDNSSLSALRYAASVASMLGSALHVLHVLPSGYRGDHIGDTGGDALKMITQRLPPGSPAPHYEVLRASDMSHAVVAYSKSQNAAAIVLGIRRRSGVTAHLPPRRTFRIIMNAPCPVLTVGHDLDLS